MTLMKYEVIVKGEFNNIKGFIAEQTFPVTIICASCNFEHPKVVIITSDSSIKEKDVYKCNFEATCKSCKNEMRITVENPKNMENEKIPDGYGEFNDLKYNKIKKDGCVISTLKTSGVEIKEIKDVSLGLLTEDNRIFKDISFDSKRSLAESYENNKIFSVINYHLDLKRVK